MIANLNSLTAGHTHHDRRYSSLRHPKYHVVTDCDGTKRYYNAKGQLHRTGAPAIEWACGAKSWYQNDLLHNVGGPAIVYTCGTKFWCQNGLVHRIDGPAAVYADGSKRWYINGDPVTEAEFLAATTQVIEMTVADIEKLVGKRVKIIK